MQVEFQYKRQHKISINKNLDPYLPVQEVPLPLNPDLQVHEKPPSVLVQSASEWQLSAFVLHSSISGDMQYTIEILKYEDTYNLNKFERAGSIFTSTGDSAADESWVALTCEPSVCVGAVGIRMTVMGKVATLVYI